MKTRAFRSNEIGCYAEALARALDAHQHLGNLPEGTLHKTGGLLPETARALESLIQSLVQQGNPKPSLTLVMAEIDRQIEYPANPEGTQAS